MDLLIAFMASYLFALEIDYSNMSWMDELYAGCFGIWFVLRAVRCYIYKTGKKPGKRSR